MKTFVKILLILGIVFTLAGGIIFVVAMGANGWDFSTLSTWNLEEKRFEFNDGVDSLNSVKITASTADVKILYHDEQKITVDGYEIKSTKGELLRKITAKFIDGELIVKDEEVVFQLFSFGVEKAEIVVKLPKEVSVDLAVNVSTGDITVGENKNECEFKTVEIETSTGEVKVECDINCFRFDVTTSTGDVYLNGKLNANSFEVEGSTAGLFINDSVIAKEIDIDHSTGDVKCNAFITAEIIEVETATGSVRLQLLGSQNDYTYTYDIGTGKSNIWPLQGGSRQVRVESGTGDVYIFFEIEPHA